MHGSTLITTGITCHQTNGSKGVLHTSLVWPRQTTAPKITMRCISNFCHGYCARTFGLFVSLRGYGQTHTPILCSTRQTKTLSFVGGYWCFCLPLFCPRPLVGLPPPHPHSVGLPRGADACKQSVRLIV